MRDTPPAISRLGIEPRRRADLAAVWTGTALRRPLNRPRPDGDVRELPLPAQFDPSRVGAVWRVPYEDRAREAPAWAESHGLGPAAGDWFRLCLLAVNVDYAQRHVAHYTRRPAEGGKYDLTVWPYHAMLGGIGHALAPAVEKAFFFHGVAWHSQPEFQVKAENRSPSTIRCSGRRSPTAPTAIAFAEGTPS